MVLCVDSRKTGFANGGRRFWRTPAEALAYAEQIERTNANEGAAGFAELSITERRDAAQALELLNGAGSLVDAAINMAEAVVSRNFCPQVQKNAKFFVNRLRELSRGRSDTLSKIRTASGDRAQICRK
jgi:hypothetical protein